MFALFVRIRVIPGQADRFLSLTEGNHQGARGEPGNLRFDVLRDHVDPDRFYLYEVYRDEAAFRAHQATPHYAAWKDAVAPLMAEPRVAERMQTCFPEPWGMSGDRAPLPPTVRRLGWLHFANDFTLDALTPLLPAGVPAAWLGMMEGAADAVAQVLKLFTGRRSDVTGKRVGWVRAGYGTNAVARPLAAVGMLLAWPAWIAGCRVLDRVGKGLRGSSSDALVADWCDDAGARARAYALMRTQDHLGATAGALCAALAAWLLALDYQHPERLAWVIAALAVPMLWMLWLCRGLADRGAAPAAAAAAPRALGWWPRDASLRLPLTLIAIASLGARLAPLLVLVQVAGIPLTPEQAAAGGAWPIWLVCLAWGALALIQAGAAALAGALTERLGARTFLWIGWLVGAVLFAALTVSTGAWLLAAGAAWGVLAGLTEGAEKTWLAELAPRAERALAFGAMGLLGAAAAVIGSGTVGWLLTSCGPAAFWLPASSLGLGAIGIWLHRR